ncbi:MAG: glycosyltransferase family 2 protein [Acidobacteriota bacterium]|nr:glycosyltransferase family 2 protein [Acidobacteriota bacterium]
MSLDVSVVIEWDNPHLLEAPGREEIALRRAAEELTDCGRPAEVIVVCGEAEVGVVRRLVEQHFASFDARVLPVRDHGYYDMKNAGAAVARGKWIVLTDSDVVLEPHAIARMVEVLESRNADVVCGAAYVDPSTLAGRLWTFLFVFPPRNESNAVRKVTRFFANLVAFRREVALRFPFPNDHRMRGQCVSLAQELGRSGITIWEAGGARTMHPAPATAGQFLRRAVWQAYDLVATHRMHASLAVAVAHAAGSIARMTGTRLLRLARHWPRVARAWWEPPFTAAVIAAFGVLQVAALILPIVTKGVPARLR